MTSSLPSHKPPTDLFAHVPPINPQEPLKNRRRGNNDAFDHFFSTFVLVYKNHCE